MNLALPPDHRSLTPQDRLLVEAVQAYEAAGGEIMDDEAAVEQARRAGGSLEKRLVHRARFLPVADRLQRALTQIRGIVGWVILGGMTLAAAAGAGTVQAVLAAPHDDKPVNFYLAFLGILLVQTILLTAWLLLMTMGSRLPATGSLGAMVVGVARAISRRINRDPLHLAAGEALSRSPGLRWGFSGISHGMWLCFNIGALAWLLVLLSTRHYTFAWETTILSERAYIPLTQGIAYLPEKVGFPAPDEEQIKNSQWRRGTRIDQRQEEEAGGFRGWSGLLIGCLVLYGITPRGLLLLVCLARRRTAVRRTPLPLQHPDFVQLKSRLMPERISLGIVNQPPAADAISPNTRSQSQPLSSWRTAAAGPIAVLGFEMNGSEADWPPQVSGVVWKNLGFVSTREERQHAIQEIEESAESLRCVVVVCPLTNTPDRGALAFITQLKSATEKGLCLVLTGGQKLRERSMGGEAVDQRVGDWLDLGHRAGIPKGDMLEMDLDHFTDSGASLLRKFLGLETISPVEAARGGRRIEVAFATIAEYVEGWGGTPDDRQRLKLHEAIASHYREGVEGWRGLLHLPDLHAKSFTSALEISADRIIHLLPSRFRLKPRWMAAGAAAGAFGCLAAAALISPAAIAALPLWAAFGAALTTILHPGRIGGESSPDAPPDYREAVDAAALFALVLDTQGRGEAAITRILDRIVEDEGSPALSSPEQVRQELDDLRHRLDLALTHESKLGGEAKKDSSESESGADE